MTKTHKGLGAHPCTRPNTALSNPALVEAGAGGRGPLFSSLIAIVVLSAITPLATAFALEPGVVLHGITGDLCCMAGGVQ